MRRPFNVSVGVNYGRDNYSGTGCDDYQCGGYCYDGHSGTDFPLSLGTTVVSPFAARVTATYNGCANYGYLGNTCGGRCGNYVRLRHSDGTDVLFCHLMLNSITVSVGQWVSCGQVVGQSASSGNSTGPHLHLGYYIGGVTRDPFAGSCSQGTSYWMSQGSYPHPIPSTTCESSCECNPGQTQSQGCGDCGSQSRTCQSNCQWGSWSSCTGQGPCSPGQTQSRACCDCGTEGRHCLSSCQWSAWGGCSGPDPEGTPPCQTGEPGVCAEGRTRCVEGCLTCVRLVEPSPELCDNLDNNCNGVADDGAPQEMGVPPPPFAARLLDYSVPQRLAPGEPGQGWAVFENVGSAPWAPGDLWLQAIAPAEDGVKSLLWDVETWLAHDVVAELTGAVEPGGFGELVFSLRLEEGVTFLVTERFRLLGPTGEAIRCPSSELEVRVSPARATAAQLPANPSTPSIAELPPDPRVLGGCGCEAGGSGIPTGLGLMMPLLVLGLFPRRRRRFLRARRSRARFSRSRSLGAAILLLGTFLAGSSCGEDRSSEATRRQGVSQPSAEPRLTVADDKASDVAAAVGKLAPGEELLDAAGDGRLVAGRRRAAPAQTSAWLTFDAWLLDGLGNRTPLPLPEGVAQEARFSPRAGGPLALIDRQGGLWIWDGGQGPARLVDHHVLPGLGWSADGQALAYVQGEVPELTLRVYRLGEERHETVVAPGPPLALPTFSPDGAELVFASAREGVPALYRVRIDGTGLVRFTNRSLTPQAFQSGLRGLPMPEGRRPPLWLAALLVFEAEGGVYAVDAIRGTLRWRIAGVDWPHLGPRGLVVRQGGPNPSFVHVSK